MDNREIIIGQYYKHFKGATYKVTDIVYDCESNDDECLKKVVIYENISKKGIKWARKYDEFASLVDHQKYPDIKQKYRFEKIEYEV